MCKQLGLQTSLVTFVTFFIQEVNKAKFRDFFFVFFLLVYFISQSNLKLNLRKVCTVKLLFVEYYLISYHLRYSGVYLRQAPYSTLLGNMQASVG